MIQTIIYQMKSSTHVIKLFQAIRFENLNSSLCHTLFLVFSRYYYSLLVFLVFLCLILCFILIEVSFFGYLHDNEIWYLLELAIIIVMYSFSIDAIILFISAAVCTEIDAFNLCSEPHGNGKMVTTTHWRTKKKKKTDYN